MQGVIIKNKLYHFTFIENVESIVEYGLVPKKAAGLMSKSDGLVYLTDSPTYIKRMARDIAKVKEYAIITVDVSNMQLSPVWWKGKSYHEWTTGAVEPSKILSVKRIKVPDTGFTKCVTCLGMNVDNGKVGM